jgi:hypothetical protein
MQLLQQSLIGPQIVTAVKWCHRSRAGFFLPSVMHTSSSTTTAPTSPDGPLRKSPQIRFLEDDEDTDEGGLSDDAHRVKAPLDNASWELEAKDLAHVLSAKKLRDISSRLFKEPCTRDHYNLELDDFDENIVKSLAPGPSSTVNDYTSFAKYFKKTHPVLPFAVWPLLCKPILPYYGQSFFVFNRHNRFTG